MKIPSKKLKEKKLSDLEKAAEYAEKYPIIHVVQNSDMPNEAIQAIRKEIEGRVLFVKKSLFQRKYPAFNFEENYFLVFAAENVSDRLMAVAYPDFAREGETVSERVAIPAGVLRNKRVADLLEDAVPQGSNFVVANERVVCESGDCVTEEQAGLLRALGKRLGRSYVRVIAVRDSLH